jgi:hypothetical protein
MEYLIEGVRNIYHKDCKKFIEVNKQLMDDVIYNNYPMLKPMFELKPDTFKELIKNIYGMDCYFLNEALRGNEIDINIQMLLLRYYCASNDKNVSLVVLKNKTIDKSEDVYHKIDMKISKKQLEFIKLQINFMRMPFDNFCSFLYENQEKFKKADIGQFKDTPKTIKLNIYVVKNVKKVYKGAVFQSEQFYELVEGAKIFLHAPNYDIFEKQLSYAYGIDYENTIRVFFRVRFLKFYLYKHYSLYDMEYYLVSGSYLLFCLGMRVSKDTDVYSLEGPDNKMLDKKKMKCNYDIKHIKNRLFININERSDYDIWNRIILYPEDNYYVFGLKTNSINIETYKRLGRFHYQKSKKSLSDLLIIKYFLNEKLDDIDLRTVNKFENLLYYRYDKFDTKKIINYFIETDAS